MKRLELFQISSIRRNQPFPAQAMPADLQLLPQTGISEFVAQFAKAHHVEYLRSGLDEWAEAATQVSGDNVELDHTGKLLVLLKKRRLINGQQLARLMTNHLKETHVRSIR